MVGSRVTGVRRRNDGDVVQCLQCFLDLCMVLSKNLAFDVVNLLITIYHLFDIKLKVLGSDHPSTKISKSFLGKL